MTLAAGIILGALGALGVAFAAESWDDSFRNSDDVERHLDLPVLANFATFESTAIATAR